MWKIHPGLTHINTHTHKYIHRHIDMRTQDTHKHVCTPASHKHVCTPALYKLSNNWKHVTEILGVLLLLLLIETESFYYIILAALGNWKCKIRLKQPKCSRFSEIYISYSLKRMVFLPSRCSYSWECSYFFLINLCSSFDKKFNHILKLKLSILFSTIFMNFSQLV